MREVADRLVRACPSAGEPWLVADDGWVRVHAGRTALAEYVLGPAEPYLHPLRTTAGELVTGPGGLRFTAAEVSGENAWGGRTPPVSGTMRHVRWARVRCHDGRAELRHWLDWRTRSGQCWLAEDRAIEVDQVDPADGSWLLTWKTRLHNTSGRRLRWGGPRCPGPRSFAAACTAESASGIRAPWRAFTGAHEESGRRSSVIFVEHPRNRRGPLLIEPEARLDLTHHLVIADGHWDPARIERYLTRRVVPRWTA
ncbi:PmoA family protein [Crossiella sp. CA-258035]|uniref:DUF6807 family protein n=1 Tax=Crossiella sp. CA-258035 TaxID=2981138 RepID=UPI0024BC3644|nr:DUF6807 family protein [Crossiella sp. CA-258035]WHT22723.1 PmoA family protein [Crossiella sp. CA-258035]